MTFNEFMAENYPRITAGSGWEYNMAKKVWDAAIINGVPTNKVVKRVKLAGFETADIKPQADIPTGAHFYAEWEI